MKTIKKTPPTTGQTIDQIVKRKLAEVNPVVKNIDWAKLAQQKNVRG